VKTLRLTIDPANLDAADAQESIARAAAILRRGGLVALPTETVYGLGANALDPDAVARIFAAKQRPSWDPIIVHIAGAVDDNPMLASLVTEIPTAARSLMAAFWPGPLTLLLPRSAAVPDAVTAGRPLVGVRMPAHPVALELIRQAGVPVAAPSANLFSHTSPTTAAHVLDDLDGRIDAVLDAGPTLHGVESTVLDPCRTPLRIYRPGAVTADQIRRIAGEVEVFLGPLPAAQPAEGLPSPGVGLRHYAPRAKMILVDEPLDRLPRLLVEAAASLPGRVGILLPSNWAPIAPPRVTVFDWGNWNAPEELAARLYAGLRALDAAHCKFIVCPVPPAEGIGAAIRDRLRKAAVSE
jgi:L-threonylcarbamoyladenylate synthase